MLISIHARPVGESIICLDGVVQVGTEPRLKGSAARVVVLEAGDDGHSPECVRLSAEQARALVRQLLDALAVVDTPAPAPIEHTCHCNCMGKGDCTRPVACPAAAPDARCSWRVCPTFPHVCSECAAGKHSTTYSVAAPSAWVR